jgi:hypothetical protein
MQELEFPVAEFERTKNLGPPPHYQLAEKAAHKSLAPLTIYIIL